MSYYKSFKAPSGRIFTVDEGGSYGPSAYLGIDGDGKSAWGWVPKADVPALALAILEAAGYSEEPLTELCGALITLKAHIGLKAEAAEREQLDKEAKALYEAYAKESVFALNTWGEMGGAKDPWIAAAKKARELHKGEAK